MYDPKGGKAKKNRWSYRKIGMIIALFGAFAMGYLPGMNASPSTVTSRRKNQLEGSSSEEESLPIPLPQSDEERCRSAYPGIPCNATHFDIRYEHIKCQAYEKTVRPLVNESTRMLLRGVYMGIVGPSKSSIGTQLTSRNGFPHPIHVSHNEKGRAVLASTDIHQGELVWDASVSTCCFNDPVLYRNFILSLPRDVICEALQFSYVSRYVVPALSNKPMPVMCVDTDEAGQMNDGGSEANIGCPKSREHCNYGGRMYALRDIRKGEEVTCRYSDFSFDIGWEYFGMGYPDLR